MCSTDSGPFALVMVGAVTDEWNRDKMSEPPPVYNLMVFPGRRNTAKQENKETQTLSPEQGGMCCSYYDPNPCFFPFFLLSDKTAVT